MAVNLIITGWLKSFMISDRLMAKKANKRQHLIVKAESMMRRNKHEAIK